jgi:tRNA (cytidine/uridine-2'-O-)-methyltransferase
MRLHLALMCPEIPNNTGAVARTAIGLGARLHLVKPYGFELTEARVRRAGLDYWPALDLREYQSPSEFLQAAKTEFDVSILISGRKRRGTQSIWHIPLPPPQTPSTVLLVFGSETRGVEHLSPEEQSLLPALSAYLPQTDLIRSYNLACAVAMAGGIVAHRIGAL